MDFNKHDSGTQRQIDRRPQNVDVLERFRDEILRALAPLEHRKSPEAAAPSPIRAFIQRTDDDVLATMPSYQYPTSPQRSSKSNFFLSGAMITVVGGALIGVTIASAGLAGVTLDDLPVTRWVTQLTGSSPNTVRNDGAQAILKDTTAKAEPSPLSSQAPATEAAVADHTPSPQPTSSSAEPVKPTDLAQPAVATPDPSQGSSSRKDGIATAITNEGTLAAAGDDESWSPFAKEKKNAELYRQYIAWQADREKSQSEQRHSSKRTAEAHASRKHRSNPANVTDNRSGSPSRESESPDRSNPTDKKDLAQQSENR